LTTLKTIFAKYSAWMLRLLAHFGPWGVLVLAVSDSILPIIPLDPVVATYVYAQPHRMLFFVLMASLGSAVGSLVPFYIGRAGGELLLLKRIDRIRLEAMQKKYETQEFLFIAIPAILPPPTPMKLLILSAGAFEMPAWLFLVSMFVGRLVRFLLLSLLVIHFGPQILSVLTNAVQHHLALFLLAIIAVAALVWIAAHRRG
jgi:membrane protein YqaA with SNARE-associated domain